MLHAELAWRGSCFNAAEAGVAEKHLLSLLDRMIDRHLSPPNRIVSATRERWFWHGFRELAPAIEVAAG